MKQLRHTVIRAGFDALYFTGAHHLLRPLLAGVGVVRLVELIPGRRRVLEAVVVAVVTLLVLIQPLYHDISSNQVLGRTDTRQLARDFLVKNYDPSLRVVIEPAVPNNFYRIEDQRTRKRQFVRGFIRDIRRAANIEAPDGVTTTYASTLNPEAIDKYRSQGFCLVATMSLIRGRAENAKVPEALAYYDRLQRESKQVYEISPFRADATPVPLHFDFSYNYYNRSYYRPGPVVRIYELDPVPPESDLDPIPLGYLGDAH